MTRKVVAWCFFTCEMSKNIHNSTFQVRNLSLECISSQWDGKFPDIIEGIVMGGGNLRMLKFNKTSNFVLKHYHFYNTILAILFIYAYN